RSYKPSKKPKLLLCGRMLNGYTNFLTQPPMRQFYPKLTLLITMPLFYCRASTKLLLKIKLPLPAKNVVVKKFPGHHLNKQMRTKIHNKSSKKKVMMIPLPALKHVAYPKTVLR